MIRVFKILSYSRRDKISKWMNQYLTIPFYNLRSINGRVWVEIEIFISWSKSLQNWTTIEVKGSRWWNFLFSKIDYSFILGEKSRLLIDIEFGKLERSKNRLVIG